MSSLSKLKTEYISYFTDVPVQKYAAMAIGRDEDTIIRWRKEDARFAEAVQMAKEAFRGVTNIGEVFEMANDQERRQIMSFVGSN